MELLHPAMWHVALESWERIHQVAAPCSVIRGSGMTCHGIRPNVRHIGRSRHVILHQSAKFIQNGPPSAEKMTSCRFSRWRISAILDCRDPIMGSLKSPCTTSYSCVLESLLSQSCWLWYVTIQTHVFWKPVFEVFCQTPKTGIISIWLLCTDMY